MIHADQVRRTLDTRADAPGTTGVSSTSTATTASTLTDANASWEVDAYVGYILTATATGYTATITSNTATVLSFTAWSTPGDPAEEIAYTVVPVNGEPVKAGPGYVFWVLVSNGATESFVQLNDSTDDSGTDLWACIAGANTIQMYNFDPPLRFGTGIFCDKTPGDTNTVTVTVGYE